MTQEFHKCMPKRYEKIRSHKNLCINVHSSIIHNTPEAEITQMSFN